MKFRKIGTSPLVVSEIGLGAMTLGTNKETAHTIIEKAIDSGINFLDTADLYDFGVNEEVIGSAIKKYRHQLIISTKVGNQWTKEKDKWSWNSSKSYIKEAVKHSLSRLQTDYIDLYQLHGGTIEDNIDETIEAFEELVTEGVIRYYGISSIRPNVISQYIKKSNIISIMMPYNILDCRAEEFIPIVEKNQISMLVRGALAKGLVTDNYSNKWGHGYLDYSAKELQALLPRIASLQPTVPLESLALHYLLHHSSVSSLLVGASKVQQLEKTIYAYEQEVKIDTLNTINELIKKGTFTQHRT